MTLVHRPHSVSAIFQESNICKVCSFGGFWPANPTHLWVNFPKVEIFWSKIFQFSASNSSPTGHGSQEEIGAEKMRESPRKITPPTPNSKKSTSVDPLKAREELRMLTAEFLGRSAKAMVASTGGKENEHSDWSELIGDRKLINRLVFIDWSLTHISDQSGPFVHRSQHKNAVEKVKIISDFAWKLIKIHQEFWWSSFLCCDSDSWKILLITDPSPK